MNIEIGFGINLKYICIGILWRDWYDIKTLMEVRDVWICFLPCVYISISIKKDILDE